MAHGATDTAAAVKSSIGYDGGLTLSFQVKDRKRSSEWYRNVLGLELLYDVEEIGWCELASPVKGVNIGLSEVESPSVGRGPVPTWGVQDIDQARRVLEEKNVRFDGETRVLPDMVKLATFYDPDGNTLMLYQALMEGP